MRRTLLVALCNTTVLIAGAPACRRRQTTEPTAPTAPTPPIAQTPPALPSQPQPSGAAGGVVTMQSSSPAALSTEGSNADQADLVLAPDGAPVVVFRQSSAVHVRRWDGSAWQPLGTPGRCATGGHVGPRAAVEPDGSVLVAVSDGAPSGATLVCVMRQAPRGGAWATLGGHFGALPSGSVAAPYVLAAPGGPVAVFRQGPQLDQLFVRRWDGSAWQPLGAGTFALPTGRGAREHRAVAVPDGLVVAWIERGGDQPVAVHLQRWSQTASAWSALPDPQGADGDTAIALSAAPDGALALAMSWNAGLRPVRHLTPGAVAWTEVGLPPSLARGAGLAHGMPALAPVAPGGVVFAWVERFVNAASHDGQRWTLAARDLARTPPTPDVQSDVQTVVAPDGAMHVVWREQNNSGDGVSRLFGSVLRRTPPS